MRRAFALGDQDVRALDALGLPWEAVLDGVIRWILIHDFPVPPGFNRATTTVAIRLDAYPPGRLDMASFRPALARADGKPINKVSNVTIGKDAYQQWSRHYAWNATVHTLGYHIRRIRGWLTHELRKR